MIDFKDLLKAGVHFGHKTSFANPKMQPYVWGAKNKIHLIDISKTAFLLEHAGNKLRDLAGTGGTILWVGTKKPAQAVIEKVATDLNMPLVVNRWIGGTLSNFAQIKKAITRLLYLRDVLKKSTNYYTKKELVMLQKKVDRLEKNVGGIIDLDFPPAAVVIVDAKKEYSAVKEAAIMNIPIIALVDTNTDPTGIDFVIPGNDDSPRSIEFIITYLADCTAQGKTNAQAALAEEKKAKAASRTAVTKPAADVVGIEDEEEKINLSQASQSILKKVITPEADEESDGGPARKRPSAQAGRPVQRRPHTTKKRD